jgi:hypothetical protein
MKYVYQILLSVGSMLLVKIIVEYMSQPAVIEAYKRIY